MPSNLSISEVKGQPPEVMKVMPVKQDGVEASFLSPEEVMTPPSVNWKLDKRVPQFLSKLYEIVDDPTTDHAVHWSFGGESFVVQDACTFCDVILPRYFKHQNFSSFNRQLNTYGFRKIDCDKWEFAKREFQRGKKDQLKYIKRNTSESKIKRSKSGKHDEAIHKSLKGLSAIISKLSQQVEVSRNIMSTFEKKVQVVEFKYKQLACALSKTIQNPSFVTELLKRQATADGTTKISSERIHVLLTCNATAQSKNLAGMQRSAVELMMDLDNELMNEVEPCEVMMDLANDS